MTAQWTTHKPLLLETKVGIISYLEQKLFPDSKGINRSFADSSVLHVSAFIWMAPPKKLQGHRQCIMWVRRGQSNFSLYKEYIDASGTVTCNDPYSSALPFVLFSNRPRLCFRDHQLTSIDWPGFDLVIFLNATGFIHSGKSMTIWDWVINMVQ